MKWKVGIYSTVFPNEQVKGAAPRVESNGTAFLLFYSIFCKSCCNQVIIRGTFF